MKVHALRQTSKYLCICILGMLILPLFRPFTEFWNCSDDVGFTYILLFKDDSFVKCGFR